MTALARQPVAVLLSRLPQIVTLIEEALGPWSPVGFVALFLCASLLMLWRLDAMGRHGLEGTALGSLVTPLCSGFGNLVFVFLLANSGTDMSAVATNAIANNATNLTVLLGIPAIFWGLQLDAAGKTSSSKTKKSQVVARREISRLSLVLTLIAAGIFTAILWALGRDGWLDFEDGLVLIAVFLLWQCVHIVDVLKNNVAARRQLQPWALAFDISLLLLGAWGLYTSLDWLVTWIGTLDAGFFRAENIGWISAWLMVLPNAVLAFYYASQKQADIVYSSQVGDGHICIPLCLGLAAVLGDVKTPPDFRFGVLSIGAAVAIHLLFLAANNGLPRWMGWVLIGSYGVFLAASF